MKDLGQFILHYWDLWLALVVILIAIAINELFDKKKQGKMLSPAEAVQWINHHDAKVLDLRDETSFRQGHIIDSLRISMDDFDSKKLEKLKEKPLILVCTRGLDSKNQAIKIRQKGFTHLMVLNGGIASWQSSGLPLVKGK